MNKLREKLFEFILRRQAARKVVMPNWKNVRSVVVLYPDNSIPHIIVQIQAADKEVVFFSLPEKKEINWLTEQPKTEVKELLVARRYEVLIDLTQESTLTMQYMAMYLRADFKVGRHMRNEIYDLIIDTPAQNTPDYLFEQIVRYLEMLSQK